MDNPLLTLDPLLKLDPILSYDPYYGWLHSFVEPLSQILETNYKALSLYDASQAKSSHRQFVDNFTMVFVCVIHLISHQQP